MKMPSIAVVVAMLSVLAVVVTGMYVTDFSAYLGNNPSTCNNCHVMDAAYEGWYHAGHKNWASCNDCHTPDDLVPKYAVKAQSGYRHVTAFLFGDIPNAIRAREDSKEVIQENCERCHAQTVSVMLAGSEPMDRYCFECHRDVAHGERGVSLLPYQH